MTNWALTNLTNISHQNILNLVLKKKKLVLKKKNKPGLKEEKNNNILKIFLKKW